MNQKIKLSQGIQSVIIGIAVIAFLLIWPLGVFQKIDVSKSNEVQLQESGPISVLHNGTQMFVAEGKNLKAVDLYVLNDMQSETITFRLYDGEYKQLWETFYVVEADAQFPGFIHIPIDMETEEGFAYYYTVEGLTKDLYLAYEDTTASGSLANGSLLYGGYEMSGINIIIRYIYNEPFSFWVTAVFGALLFGLAKAGCVGIDRLFSTKWKEKNKEITVQKLIQWIANPFLGLVTLVALFTVFPGRVFGVGVVNYGFYYLGIIIGALILLFGINYKRKGTKPLLVKETVLQEWPQWLMAVAFAGVLWSCYEYMNGLYNIHHMYASCKMLTWFGIALLCTFDKKYIFKIWNLVYFIVAFVWRKSYIKPYIGVNEQEELYKLQSLVIIVGIFLALQMVLSIVNILRKKEKITSKICVPYAALVAAWMVLMLVFRNGRDWIVLMAVMFTIFYYCMWRWEKKDKLLQVFCNGVILNFIYMVLFCLMHRPYLRFRHNRFGLGFHTVTMTGYYLALVVGAIIVRMFIQYRKSGRWMDCWKEISLLGIANSYLFITLSRTGYLAAAAVQLFVLVFLTLVWEKKKMAALLQGLAVMIGISVVTFPMVFTAQRILPAVYDEPVYSEIEVWEYSVEKGDRKDSELYMDITAFVKIMGNKLFGLETGNISIASIGEAIKEDMTAWKKLREPVYVKNNHYLLTSEAEMYEEEDVSNGRFDIFKSYIEHWNLTGHEAMGVPLADGSIAVHAHNTFLQLIHDNGLITGIVFVVLGVVSFFYAAVHYVKEKKEDSYLILTIAVITAFAIAGLVEWIFQINNFFGIALLVVITPLLFAEKK